MRRRSDTSNSFRSHVITLNRQILTEIQVQLQSFPYSLSPWNRTDSVLFFFVFNLIFGMGNIDNKTIELLLMRDNKKKFLGMTSLLIDQVHGIEIVTG